MNVTPIEVIAWFIWSHKVVSDLIGSRDYFSLKYNILGVLFIISGKVMRYTAVPVIEINSNAAPCRNFNRALVKGDILGG